MRISLIAVSSLNALITRNDEPGAGFASEADSAWFRQKLRDSDLVLLGGATWRAASDIIRRNALEGPPRWVFTRNPAACRDAAVPGSLEFRGLDRDELLQDIARQSYEDIALVGGPALSTWFLDHGLVSDIYLTIEPVLFAGGTPMVTPSADIPLELVSAQPLSGQTLLLHYRV